MKIGIIAKPNTKGQFVIPHAFRKKLGIVPGTPINVVVRKDSVVLFPLKKEIHFYSSDGELKPSVRKRLDRLHKDVVQGKNLSPRFDRVEDAISYLHS
jgi:AbrB family looped-hinge helix DNA binding protein